MSTFPNNSKRQDNGDDGPEEESCSSEELQFSQKPSRPESHPEARATARAIMRKHREVFAKLAE